MTLTPVGGVALAGEFAGGMVGVTSSRRWAGVGAMHVAGAPNGNQKKERRVDRKVSHVGRLRSQMGGLE